MSDTHQQSSRKNTGAAVHPFDDLFAKYEKAIFNVVYRMVGDYEDATDLTSQTFLHALRGYDSFRGEAQAYTWLYRIAMNLCKNHFRKRDREARFQTVSLDAPIYADNEEMDRDIEDSSRCPVRLMEGRELQEHIQHAIMQLSVDLRTVILLRDVQGLSYQEIADITNCTVEAVKSRIFRARGYLRKVLAPHLQQGAEGGEEDPTADADPQQRRKK